MPEGQRGRTSLLLPSIQAQIAEASPKRQRRIAIAVAARALRARPTHPVELNALLTRLERGEHDSSTKGQIETIALELDDRYLELHGKQGAFDHSKEEQAAFALARAAAALLFACEADPLVAASEATYEALAAIGDEAALDQLIRDVPD